MEGKGKPFISRPFTRCALITKKRRTRLLQMKKMCMFGGRSSGVLDNA